MESQGLSQQCLPSNCGPVVMSNSTKPAGPPSAPSSPNIWLPLLVAASSLFVFVWFGGTPKSTDATDSSRHVNAATPATPAQMEVHHKAPHEGVETDPTTGLRKTKGWELVAANCSGCHSTKLVVQNRGSGDQWRSMIRWMQETQNLWPFAPDVEDAIVSYLSSNYGEQAQSRRNNLPPQLMPPFQFADSSPGQ